MLDWREVPKTYYDAVDAWNKKKNLKNFYGVYVNGFRFKHLWQRPLWRVWRVIRNTWINKKYQLIYFVDREQMK